MFSPQNNIFALAAKVFKWFRFPVSFKKSLGMKTPNRTVFAQHLQTPVQSWLFYDNKERRSQSRRSLFSTRGIVRCRPLCSAVILLIPVLLSSLSAKHVCVALPGSCKLRTKSAFRVPKRRWQGFAAQTRCRGKTNQLLHCRKMS